MKKEKILGHYFSYCQFCVYDGSCELKHFELMGLPSAGKVDDTPYSGHEALWWHFSMFQKNLVRGACAGRIAKIVNFFFPLQCECGTVIDSDCQKLTLNEKGKERKALAEGVAREKGVALSELGPEDLPEIDPDYRAIVE